MFALHPGVLANTGMKVLKVKVFLASCHGMSLSVRRCHQQLNFPHVPYKQCLATGFTPACRKNISWRRNLWCQPFDRWLETFATGTSLASASLHISCDKGCASQHLALQHQVVAADGARPGPPSSARPAPLLSKHLEQVGQPQQRRLPPTTARGHAAGLQRMPRMDTDRRGSNASGHQSCSSCCENLRRN